MQLVILYILRGDAFEKIKQWKKKFVHFSNSSSSNNSIYIKNDYSNK